MSLILLEALAALALLLFIVWWTMFAGRERGEPKPPATPAVENSEGKAAPQRAPPH